MDDLVNDFGLRIRTALASDVDAVLAFWAQAAEGTSISDDRAGVARLIDRDPDALLLAVPGGGLGEPAAAGAPAAGPVIGSVLTLSPVNGGDSHRAAAVASTCVVVPASSPTARLAGSYTGSTRRFTCPGVPRPQCPALRGGC